MIRLLQYRLLKHQGKDTLNENGWSQGITAEKLKEQLLELTVSHLSDEYYQMSEVKKELSQLLESYKIKELIKLPTHTELKKIKNEIDFI